MSFLPKQQEEGPADEEDIEIPIGAEVLCCAFSGDGEVFAVGASDGVVRVYDDSRRVRKTCYKILGLEVRWDPWDFRQTTNVPVAVVFSWREKPRTTRFFLSKERSPRDEPPRWDHCSAARVKYPQGHRRV